ncbi:hypothetical protein FOA52_015834 [Chlamydomonas sp. UWO 241]|nr:hypothetical protein FOA52_015834 [Chlamydomonas sp. UWO 241]
MIPAVLMIGAPTGPRAEQADAATSSLSRGETSHGAPWAGFSTPNTGMSIADAARAASAASVQRASSSPASQLRNQGPSPFDRGSPAAQLRNLGPSAFDRGSPPSKSFPECAIALRTLNLSRAKPTPEGGGGGRGGTGAGAGGDTSRRLQLQSEPLPLHAVPRFGRAAARVSFGAGPDGDGDDNDCVSPNFARHGVDWTPSRPRSLPPPSRQRSRGGSGGGTAPEAAPEPVPACCRRAAAPNPIAMPNFARESVYVSPICVTSDAAGDRLLAEFADGCGSGDDSGSDGGYEVPEGRGMLKWAIRFGRASSQQHSMSAQYGHGGRGGPAGGDIVGSAPARTPSGRERGASGDGDPAFPERVNMAKRSTSLPGALHAVTRGEGPLRNSPWSAPLQIFGGGGDGGAHAMKNKDATSGAGSLKKSLSSVKRKLLTLLKLPMAPAHAAAPASARGDMRPNDGEHDGGGALGAGGRRSSADRRPACYIEDDDGDFDGDDLVLDDGFGGYDPTQSVSCGGGDAGGGAGDAGGSGGPPSPSKANAQVPASAAGYGTGRATQGAPPGARPRSSAGFAGSERTRPATLSAATSHVESSNTTRGLPCAFAVPPHGMGVPYVPPKPAPHAARPAPAHSTSLGLIVEEDAEAAEEDAEAAKEEDWATRRSGF